MLKLLARNAVNLLVFLLPVAFYQPFFDPFGPAQLFVARLLIPLICFLIFYISFKTKEPLRFDAPVTMGLVIYSLICFASVLFAYNKEISFKYAYEIFIFIGGALTISAAATKRDMNRLMILIVLTNSLISLYGVMQHFELDPFGWSTNFGGRPMGTIGNPDFFAGHILVGGFIALAYAVFSKKYRLLNIILLIPVLLSLYYSKVVGAWLGFMTGAFVFAVFVVVKKGISIKATALAASILIITGGAIAPFAVKKIYESKKRSIDHRLIMWEAAVDMLKDSPVIGKGTGMYRVNYPKYQGELLNKQGITNIDYVVTWMPHQNYLLLLSETGILGFGAMFLAVFAFIVFAAKNLKNTAPEVAGIVSAVFAVLGASLVNTFYNIPATMFCFFFLLAAVYKYRGNAVTEKPMRSMLVRILIGLSAFCLVYSVWQDSKTLASNAYLKKANKLTEDSRSDLAIPMYERIIAMRPIELNPQADVGMYYYAAEAYRKAGAIEKAREFYKKDLEINPFCPEVNNMYGAMSGQMGDLDTAFKYLNMAIFTAPHYEAAYTNLATAYMAKGDRAGAKDTLLRFVKVNGTNERIEGLLKAAEK